MLKQNKWKIIITTLITLIPMLVGCILWSRLPDTIAIHFGVDNTADGWSSKPFAVFAIPTFMAALHLIGLTVTSMDPKFKNIGKKPFGLVFWICPSISLLVGTVTYAMALGAEINIGFVCCLFLGILFILIGNFLPKAKQNYSFGIKLPWTLNDEDNWNHTHRIAGWSTAIAGVIITATAFLYNFLIIITVLCISILIPIVYSFIYYRQHRK